MGGISGTSILKETVPLEQEIQRLALEGPIQGNIDLVKDLTGDAKALLSDMDKEEKFYENALGFKGFSRPPVKILWPPSKRGLALPATTVQGLLAPAGQSCGPPLGRARAICCWPLRCGCWLVALCALLSSFVLELASILSREQKPPSQNQVSLCIVI